MSLATSICICESWTSQGKPDAIGMYIRTTRTSRVDSAALPDEFRLQAGSVAVPVVQYRLSAPNGVAPFSQRRAVISALSSVWACVETTHRTNRPPAPGCLPSCPRQSSGRSPKDVARVEPGTKLIWPNRREAHVSQSDENVPYTTRSAAHLKCQCIWYTRCYVYHRA